MSSHCRPILGNIMFLCALMNLFRNNLFATHKISITLAHKGFRRSAKTLPEKIDSPSL